MMKLVTVLSLTMLVVLMSSSLYAQVDLPYDTLGAGWSVEFAIIEHDNDQGRTRVAVDEVYAGFDFDQDGNMEFFYVTDESNPNSSWAGQTSHGAFVYLYEWNGSAFEQIWSYSDTTVRQGGASFPAAAVGDLDGDGNLELLLAIPKGSGTGNPLLFHVWEGVAGSGLPSSPDASWNFNADTDCNCRVSALAVGDLDNDGVQEVVAGFRKWDPPNKENLMIFSLDGAFAGAFTSWKVEVFDTTADLGSIYSAAVTDLDGDGWGEAYFASDYITLYEATAADTYVISHSANAVGTDNWNLANAVVSFDIDGDGTEELVMADWRGNVKIIDGVTDAQNIDSTHIFTIMNFGNARAFTGGDFDGDGAIDLFIAQNYGGIYHGTFNGAGAVTDSASWDWELVWQDTSGASRPYTLSFSGDARTTSWTGVYNNDLNNNGFPELFVAIEDFDTTYAVLIMLESDAVVGIKLDGGQILESYRLSQNYPNPFNPSTNIDYSLSVAGDVKITIYNLLGQKVVTLVNEFQAAGDYTVSWNGLNVSGNTVATGIYTYELRTGGVVLHKKMTFIK